MVDEVAETEPGTVSEVKQLILVNITCDAFATSHMRSEEMGAASSDHLHLRDSLSGNGLLRIVSVGRDMFERPLRCDTKQHALVRAQRKTGKCAFCPFSLPAATAPTPQQRQRIKPDV